MAQRAAIACAFVAAGMLALASAATVSAGEGERMGNALEASYGTGRSDGAGSGEDALRAQRSGSGADGFAEGGEEPITDMLSAFLGEDDGLLADFSSELPAAFSEEVISPREQDAVAVSDGEAVVGIMRPGVATEVFDEVAAELADNGWVRVESGQERASTFLKEGGRYTWLVVSCVEVDGLVGVTICAS